MDSNNSISSEAVPRNFFFFFFSSLPPIFLFSFHSVNHATGHLTDSFFVLPCLFLFIFQVNRQYAVIIIFLHCMQHSDDCYFCLNTVSLQIINCKPPISYCNNFFPLPSFKFSKCFSRG